MKKYMDQKNDSYFEGWYFKQQSESAMLAVIMGMSRDGKGQEEAFIQINTPKESYSVSYPMEDFFMEEDYFYIRIGKNYVTEENLYLDIEEDYLKVKGCLKYGRFSKLRYPIMGPFTNLPMMECKHGIISMRHAVHGTIKLNHEKLVFDKGVGYAEKDYGCSFPKEYSWTQCHYMGEDEILVFSAVAVIPYMGIKFTGTLNLVGYQGKLYRMATYLGARVICKTDHTIMIKQQKYLLTIRLLSGYGNDLKAPDNGAMNRTIKEQLAGKVEYTFCKGDETLFRFVSEQASYEVDCI